MWCRHETLGVKEFEYVPEMRFKILDEKKAKEIDTQFNSLYVTFLPQDIRWPLLAPFHIKHPTLFRGCIKKCPEYKIASKLRIPTATNG